MSEERKRRLAKLVRLERRLKSVHETRHAGHLAAASRSAEDAAAISARIDAPDSLSGLFPELYHRHVEASLAAREKSLEQARREEKAIAAATIRATRVGERYRDAARAVEEHASALELQELIDRAAGRRKE